MEGAAIKWDGQSTLVVNSGKGYILSLLMICTDRAIDYLGTPSNEKSTSEESIFLDISISSAVIKTTFTLWFINSNYRSSKRLK